MIPLLLCCHQCRVSPDCYVCNASVKLWDILWADLKRLTLVMCSLELAQQIIQVAGPRLEQVTLRHLTGELTGPGCVKNLKGELLVSIVFPENCWSKNNHLTALKLLSITRHDGLVYGHLPGSFQKYNEDIAMLFFPLDLSCQSQLGKGATKTTLVSTSECWLPRWLFTSLEIEILHLKGIHQELALQFIVSSADSIQSITLQSDFEQGPQRSIMTLPLLPSILIHIFCAHHIRPWRPCHWQSSAGSVCWVKQFYLFWAMQCHKGSTYFRFCHKVSHAQWTPLILNVIPLWMGSGTYQASKVRHSPKSLIQQNANSLQ